MVEYALCTQTLPHLVETAAIVLSNFPNLISHYVASNAYTYNCHMLMIYSLSQMSETYVSPFSIARNVDEHQVTKAISLSIGLTQRLVIISGSLNKCLSHHTYCFPVFPSNHPVFFFF
jgi:hypothetical protein